MSEINATADQFDREEPWTQINVLLQPDGIWLHARLGTKNSHKNGAVKLTEEQVSGLEALIAQYRQRPASAALPMPGGDPFNLVDWDGGL